MDATWPNFFIFSLRKSAPASPITYRNCVEFNNWKFNANSSDRMSEKSFMMHMRLRALRITSAMFLRLICDVISRFLMACFSLSIISIITSKSSNSPSSSSDSSSASYLSLYVFIFLDFLS